MFLKNNTCLCLLILKISQLESFVQLPVFHALKMQNLLEGVFYSLQVRRSSSRKEALELMGSQRSALMSLRVCDTWVGQG